MFICILNYVMERNGMTGVSATKDVPAAAIKILGQNAATAFVSIAEKIAIELHNEYSLAYSPSHAEPDGKFRKIEVRLKQPKGLPDLQARWRTGYYAPTE